MKYVRWCALVVLLPVASPSFAQSSVSLYGVADVSVRYTTNANADNDHLLELTNGATTASRWGLRGSEDLSSQLRAIFVLESGINLDDGTVTQSGTMFGRQAYVGMQGNWGTIALGRQNTVGWTFSGDFDPLFVGNYQANSWPYSLDRVRANNVTSYSARFGGLNFGAGYGFGEGPGNPPDNSYWGLQSSYSWAHFGIGAVYQEVWAQSNYKQRMWSVAGRYQFASVGLYLAYIGGRDRSGAIDNDFMNDPSRDIFVTPEAAANAPRTDAILATGVRWQAAPAVVMAVAFYYDDIGNKNGISGNGGKRYTGVLLSEYSFSPRTQVYGTLDYNRVTGGAYTELPGKSNQLGVAAGLRLRF
ncbi:porin [Uliginosibacterium sp. sgz301328]|uniref:porin n=1 Tax=Uliginosibacterium sp. sgz301328 TaxID=3243764 RepID=UPI00359DB253